MLFFSCDARIPIGNEKQISADMLCAGLLSFIEIQSRQKPDRSELEFLANIFHKNKTYKEIMRKQCHHDALRALLSRTFFSSEEFVSGVVAKKITTTIQLERLLTAAALAYLKNAWLSNDCMCSRVSRFFCPDKIVLLDSGDIDVKHHVDNGKKIDKFLRQVADSFLNEMKTPGVDCLSTERWKEFIEKKDYLISGGILSESKDRVDKAAKILMLRLDYEDPWRALKDLCYRWLQQDHLARSKIFPSLSSSAPLMIKPAIITTRLQRMASVDYKYFTYLISAAAAAGFLICASLMLPDKIASSRSLVAVFFLASLMAVVTNKLAWQAKDHLVKCAHKYNLFFPADKRPMENDPFLLEGDGLKKFADFLSKHILDSLSAGMRGEWSQKVKSLAAIEANNGNRVVANHAAARGDDTCAGNGCCPVM